MSEHPSLHEIAAMPFPASVKAMREHYNPAWGKPEPEGELRRYRVVIDYEYSGRDTWETEVNARSAEEAEELAGDEFDKADLDLPWGVDVDQAKSKAEEIGPPRLASVDTHPEGGDATQIVAPFMSGAVPKADAQKEPNP